MNSHPVGHNSKNYFVTDQNIPFEKVIQAAGHFIAVGSKRRNHRKPPHGNFKMFGHNKIAHLSQHPVDIGFFGMVAGKIAFAQE